MYIIELIAGFESNLYSNVTRKRSKYKDVIKDQQRNFNSAIFINLSISSLGIFDRERILFFGNARQLRVRQKRTTALHEEDNVYCHQNDLLYFLL